MSWEAYSGNPALADQAIDSARADAEQSKMGTALARVRAKEMQQYYENELFEAKKLVHGQVAVRRALQDALKQIAPDHPLNDPEYRGKIIDEAEAKAQPDDDWIL